MLCLLQRGIGLIGIISLNRAHNQAVLVLFYALKKYAKKAPGHFRGCVTPATRFRLQRKDKVGGVVDKASAQEWQVWCYKLSAPKVKLCLLQRGIGLIGE